MPRRALAILSQPDETTLAEIYALLETIGTDITDIEALQTTINSNIQGINLSISSDGIIPLWLKGILEELQTKR